MSRKSPWTEEQMAHSLVMLEAAGGNVSQVSRQTGIPRETVGQWSRGVRRPAASRAALAKRKADMQQERSLMAEEFLKLMRAGVLKAYELLPTATSLRDVVLLMGLSTDKWIALTGGSRSTHDVNVTVTLADQYRKAMVKTIDVPGRVVTDPDLERDES